MTRLRTVALAMTSSLATALLFVRIGFALDGLRSGRMPTPAEFVLLGLLAVIGALAAWSVPALGAGEQALEERGLRRRIVGHVLDLGAAERTRERAGRIVSTATDGVERAAAYRATFLGPMIASLLVPPLVLVVVAAFIDVPAALWLLIAVPVIPLAVGGFQAAFRSVSQRYRANSRQLSASFLDAFQGLTTLRQFNAGPAMGRTLAQAAEDLRRHVMRLLAGNQIVLLVVDAVFALAMITGATALAMIRLGDGAITPGQAIALVLLATLLLDPLDRIGQFFYVGMGGMASVKEIRTMLAERSAVVEEATATDAGAGQPATTATGDSTAEPWSIEFQDVTFAYDQTTVLDRVTFAVAAGESVALIGASGSGKSTIANLLGGSLRPDGGRLLVGGRDVAGLPLDWLRRHTTMVAQQTFLFTGTLRSNLLLAAPDATEEDLWRALAAAHLDDFIRDLPDGLETQVGERGLSLSGGQAQRVGLARAYLKDSPILILDEPTSQVDLASEQIILAAIGTLTHDRTVLTISHRRATIAHADRVVVLTDGRTT